MSIEKDMKQALEFFAENNLAPSEVIKRGWKQGLTEGQTRAGMVNVWKRVMSGEKIKMIRLAWQAWEEAKKVQGEDFMALEQDKEGLRMQIDKLSYFKKWAIWVGAIGWVLTLLFVFNMYVPFAYSDQEEFFYSQGQSVRPQYYNGHNYRSPRIDASTRSTITTDYMHHEIHDGSAYFISGTTVLGSGATNILSFYVPSGNTRHHITMQIGTSGIANIYFLENVNFRNMASNLVAGATPYNHDRNSDNKSGCTVQWVNTSSPFASGSFASATTIYDTRIGTNGVGNTSIGGQQERENEIILRSGATYVLYLYSGAAANNINYTLHWYEHTNLDN